MPEELPNWDGMLEAARRAAGAKRFTDEHLHNYVAFARRMRQARDAHEPYWSLHDLSRETGIDVGSLHRIENGLRPHVSAHSVFVICQALRTHPLWMWFGDRHYHGSGWYQASAWADADGPARLPIRRKVAEVSPVSTILKRRAGKQVG